MLWPILARTPLLMLIAAVTAVAAAFIGLASPLAAMVGALAGAVVALAYPAPVASVPATEPAELQPQVDVAELIEALADPVLLVERQIVTRANAPARALIGEHIVGEDVRLAIRHPAAAARLIGPVPENAAALPPVELVGLGTRERRWEMVVHYLASGARLVRLSDRTGAYAIERMRVDFVANASHELRTPLSTLIGFIEALEEAGEDKATRKRFLTIMAGEAKRMQRLVEDLMSLSRIEADKYSVPREGVALPPLVDEVREALRTGLVPDAERIVVATEDGLPAVQGDRAQLSQLLHNLIGNAAKYGRPGTPIHVSLNTEGGMVRLAVEDEGEGIAPEHIPRLTERFYRVDPSRSRAQGGTGLGLAIVKHIVERHRGRLDIASTPGRGTRVSVLLPAAPAVSSNCHASVTESDSNGPSGSAGSLTGA